MLLKLCGLLRRTPRCDHRYGEWKFFRSRVTGWTKVRYCEICKACDRRSVTLHRLKQA